jgi:hypothetical protein
VGPPERPDGLVPAELLDPLLESVEQGDSLLSGNRKSDRAVSGSTLPPRFAAIVPAAAAASAAAAEAAATASAEAAA